MVIRELSPIPPDDFKAILDEKGWSPSLLARRWGLSERRVRQIIADPNRPRYLNDALGNLPLIIKT